jgi:MFS family permease
MLSSAASSSIWGKLSDIWGRKLILLCAVAGFFASFIICALSASIIMLIVGCAVQGVSQLVDWISSFLS